VTARIAVRIAAISQETETIRRLELRAPSDVLPPFTAGAHIDVYLPVGHLPVGLSRSYSLLNSQDERHRYVIGVYLEPNGRGGSRYLHEQAVVGGELLISPPRNLFALNEDAATSVLIGGGIGVTPLLAMAKRLDRLNRSWRLHYCCRSRPLAAFHDDLALHGHRVKLRFDDECQGFLDIEGQMRALPGAHFYCCGPKPMLAAFQAAAQAAGLPAAQGHVEDFQPVADLPSQGGFVVELARSGRSLHIPTGKTILETLQQAGVTATSSCEVGICGECQTTVLEGVPDHHDSVLSDAERESNRLMMICCSGAKTAKLLLDL
jgi:ferredoxin-NADP reductase